MKKWINLIAIGMLLWGVSAVFGASDADTQTQLQLLQQRVAELETQLNQQTYQQRNAEMMREMLKELSAAPASQAADTGLTAGYDKRFFIKSTDDQFKLEIDTLMQFRHSYLAADECKNELLRDGTRPDVDEKAANTNASAFEFERARLYLQGHVLKDLNYKIIFEADDDSSDGAYLYEYELSYAFMPELGISAGRYKGAYGKQEPTGSGRLMFADRSLADQVFNIDRVTGVGLFGTVDLGEIKPFWQAMIFNDFRNNNSSPISQNDNSPGLAARIATPLLGASMDDFADESDLEYHENPVALVGCSFAYTNDRDEKHFAGGVSDDYSFLARGSDGRSDVFNLLGEASLVGADISMKYRGLSVTLEGFYQHITTDYPGDYVCNTDFGGPRDSIVGSGYDNYGWYAQGGCFLVPRTFELIGRVSGVCVDNTNDSYEYAGGWNWYLSGQDLKLTMDITYIDSLPIISSPANFDGIQNNSLFLVRTQLQFQF